MELPWSNRKERDAWRKLNRLCRECAALLADDDGILCLPHKLKAREFAAKYRKSHPAMVAKWSDKANPERRKAYRKKIYHEHKGTGLCVKCSRTAMKDSNLCMKHQRASEKHMKAYRRRPKVKMLTAKAA